MSILIKGMNIPEMADNTGIKMEFRKLDGVVTIGIMTGGYSCSEQWHYYPITEVPTPHGRLIDEDMLNESLDAHRAAIGDGNVADAIDETPTVIEAEEKRR